MISCRWVDINKGDDQAPEYRSRLVAREVKRDRRQDMFAATPPLTSLRFLVSLCASTQRKRRPFRMLFIDVKRAYFHAPVKRNLFVELPPEDRDPADGDCVGRLLKSMYGTRDAA